MRDPSIHIRESKLMALLNEILPGNEEECRMAIIELLDKAKTHSVPSRSITVTNDKLLKQTNKLKLAGRSDTSIFAQMLLYIRRQKRHRGLHLISPGDKDWLDLKAVTKLATEFSNEFGLSIKEGYGEYIKIGMSKMANFSIFKFKNMHSSICNHYEAIQEIKRDRTPQATEECHDIYLKILSEKVGSAFGFKENPEKYQCFIKVKDEANKYRVTYKQYIAAQFAGFDWKSGVPDPLQLVGDKARQRLQSYAFEHGIKMGGHVSNIDFSKIKKK